MQIIHPNLACSQMETEESSSGRLGSGGGRALALLLRVSGDLGLSQTPKEARGSDHKSHC